MSTERILQVWFGILGLAAGAALLLPGILASEPAQAANEGISITFVHTAPSK